MPYCNSVVPVVVNILGSESSIIHLNCKTIFFAIFCDYQTLFSMHKVNVWCRDGDGKQRNFYLILRPYRRKITLSAFSGGHNLTQIGGLGFRVRARVGLVRICRSAFSGGPSILAAENQTSL